MLGFEISPEFAQIARNRLAQPSLLNMQQGGEGFIHVDDARHLLRYLQPGSVDFCLTSPPYWDILLQDRTADYKERRDYGDTVDDIGKIGDYQQIINALADIMKQVFVVLRPLVNQASRRVRS